MKRSLITLACIALCAVGVSSQSQSPAAAKDLADLVHKQFGPDFEIVTQSPTAKIVASTAMGEEPVAWIPMITGDLNGDGSEDAIIIARNKNATIGADAYGYKVVDAYNEHFGYGNPEVTTGFNAEDPIHNLILLVIHGSGAEGWRAEHPQAKYVLINIPFEKVSLARATLKKKKTRIDAIRVDESDTISSLVVWDGKRYRYIPGGGSL